MTTKIVCDQCDATIIDGAGLRLQIMNGWDNPENTKDFCCVGCVGAWANGELRPAHSDHERENHG